MKRKTYKYSLTVVDVASLNKEAEPLTMKDCSTEVAGALERIYKWNPLRCAKLLQVDPKREFMCTVSQLLAEQGLKSDIVMWIPTETRALLNVIMHRR